MSKYPALQSRCKTQEIYLMAYIKHLNLGASFSIFATPINLTVIIIQQLDIDRQ